MKSSHFFGADARSAQPLLNTCPLQRMTQAVTINYIPHDCTHKAHFFYSQQLDKHSFTKPPPKTMLQKKENGLIAYIPGWAHNNMVRYNNIDNDFFRRKLPFLSSLFLRDKAEDLIEHSTGVFVSPPRQGLDENNVCHEIAAHGNDKRKLFC